MALAAIAHYARSLGQDLLAVLYPRLCAGSGVELLPGEQGVALSCLQALPQTYYHLSPYTNPLRDRLADQAPISMAAACYFYSEATPIRPLIHQLKYDHRDDIGLALGRYYGAQLAASSLVTAAPLLVPIPLHPSKRRKRGFNQAARIAAGIATTTGLELRQDLLLRQTATPSQTKVAPEQRWANVKDIFTVPKPLPARPLILVDDVITTGATMGSALRTLATARAQELRVLGIASAEGR